MIGSQSAGQYRDDQGERRFRLLAEALPQVVWTARRDGERDYLNRRWCEYSGLAAAESLGRGWLEAVHPEDLVTYRRAWTTAVVEARAFEVEYRLRRHDGEFRWFLSRAEPIRDDDGQAVRWYGACTDIHDRKTAADRELLESRERLRLATDAARLGFWDWDIAADRITWSDSLRPLWGTSPEDFGSTLRGFLGLVHPSDRARVEAAMRRAVDEGTSYEVEFRVVGPEGGDRWGRVRGQVDSNREGRPVRMSGIVVDVTARKEAEEALRTGEERFRLAALASNGLVYDWDPATGTVERFGRVLDVTGFPPDDAERTASWWASRIHPDDLPAARAALADTFDRGGGRYTLLYRFQHRDGHWIHLEDSALALRDAGGSLSRVIGFTVDVTERHRVDRDLRESRHLAERIADVCPVVLTVNDLSEDRPVYSNREMSAVLGYPREPFTAPGPGTLAALMHPEDYARLPAHLDRVRALGDGEVADLEFRLRHAGGGWRWFYARDAVFRRDASGAVTQIINAAVDVTDRRLAEESLRRGEAEYRSLFESAGMGNAEVDLDTGRFVRVNRTFCDLTGYTADEFLGMTFPGLTHPDDRDRNPRELAPFVRDEQDRFQIEKRFIRKDGSAVWVHVVTTLIRDASGRPVRLLGSAHDITERKRAEEQLRGSELRLRATFENAAVGIAHVAPDGRWLHVNETLCAITGYPRDELLTRTFQDITHPDDLEADLAHVRRLLAGESSTYTMEKRYIRKDGRVVWGNLTVSLIRTAAGSPEFFIAVVEDISSRKQAEEDVRRLNAERNASLRELQTIFDTAPVGINVARDPACKVIVGNTTLNEMIGMGTGENVSVSREDAEILPFRILQDGREAPADSLPVQRAAATGLPVGDRLYEIVRADGSRIQMIARANPIREATGEVTGAVGVCVDVTALKRAEAALLEADRRKDEFLAMLAHELRNPLSAIVAAHALAQQDGIPPDELRWAEEVIDRQLRQLGRLIDDLLDVSRITRGKIRLKKERVDLATVVKRAVASVRGFVADRRHELNVQVSPEPMPLDADPARLEQVLANLLNNAAKYTDPGGRITLSAGTERNEVVVRVRDNGLGISPEMLPKVFELFAQVDNSVSRSQGGLGIGLTLVRTLTTMHGGRVSAASDGPGLGSEFTVRLPRPASGAATPAPATASAAGERARRTRRVLAVDDNADTLRGTARLLSRRGHEVFTAQDGPSAVVAARAHRPEVVLLDIGLPGMSGYEVAAALRLEFGEAPVLVAISGYAQEKDRGRSREAGFNHHLAKPVNIEALLAIVESEGGATEARRPGSYAPRPPRA